MVKQVTMSLGVEVFRDSKGAMVVYSPDGRKVRSKPQLARCLGDVIDYGSFDFRSGKVNNLLLRKQRKQRSSQVEYSRGVRTDASLVPPIRQTASIFKQPVTVYKTQEGKVKTDFKHGPQEKPKQVSFSLFKFIFLNFEF
ncbi:Methyl-CpG-binding domain protein 2 [Homalodisca vitripennis]|nr:Methyl-CpG-binding domain protein 2 [Homalodisca vitripennis]